MKVLDRYLIRELLIPIFYTGLALVFGAYPALTRWANESRPTDSGVKTIFEVGSKTALGPPRVTTVAETDSDRTQQKPRPERARLLNCWIS